MHINGLKVAQVIAGPIYDADKHQRNVCGYSSLAVSTGMDGTVIAVCLLVQLHGTCLGFEALAIIVSRDADILSSYDSYDDASPLILTEDGQSESAFFGAMPRELLKAVQEKPLAMENHGRGRQKCARSLAPM